MENTQQVALSEEQKSKLIEVLGNEMVDELIETVGKIESSVKELNMQFSFLKIKVASISGAVGSIIGVIASKIMKVM